MDKQQPGTQIMSRREVKIATVETAVGALLTVEAAETND